MKIAQTYSHLNGLEYLHFHNRKLWQEIKKVVASVDAIACRTKISKERGMAGKPLFSPVAMNRRFKEALSQYKWAESRIAYWVTDDEKLIRQTLGKDAETQKQEIEQAGKRAILSYNQTDFVKKRVALEIQFGKYAFVAYDLFVKHLAFYVRDKIDVGVEILPMKSLQAEMSSGPGYYEGELYNIIRNGRGVPAVPLIIIGVAP
jgi:hypothetical protein